MEDTKKKIDEIDKILMSYKRYPYGTDEFPHITGEEARQALIDLIIDEKIAELKKIDPSHYYLLLAKDSTSKITTFGNLPQRIKQLESSKSKE